MKSCSFISRLGAISHKHRWKTERGGERGKKEGKEGEKEREITEKWGKDKGREVGKTKMETGKVTGGARELNEGTKETSQREVGEWGPGHRGERNRPVPQHALSGCATFELFLEK